MSQDVGHKFSVFKTLIFLILFDHKCYAWLESPGTVEKLGTIGFEFT
jgi:hypothetical protein